MSKNYRDENRLGGYSRRNILRTATAAGATAIAAGATLGLPNLANAAEPRNTRGAVWPPTKVPEPVAQSEGMVEVDDGVKLWYWDTGGNGQPLILMHAGTGSGNVWGYQQPVFARAGYRVIGYSRRGYYKSDAGSNDSPGVAAEDLGKLIGHLKLDQVHLLAAAHGGFFMLDYLLENPKKVRSATILSSLMGITDSDYVEAGERLRPPFFQSLPHSFQELGPSYRAGNAEGVALWERHALEAIPGERIHPQLSQPLTWALLESINVPTLLITGDGDLYLPPSLLRMQALHMRHAEVNVIDEAGHAANWEQPEKFNKLVLNFLGRHKFTKLLRRDWYKDAMK